jgi:hypothetical protein
MDPAKKLQWERPGGLDGAVERPAPLPAAPDHLASILRLVSAPGDAASSAAAQRPSSPQEWAALIERVRSAAGRAREVESQAQEQEQRVQELLERVREDMRAASERVRAAEMRAAEIQAHAESMVRAADERAAAAEERARVAEEWLFRVHETISTEFSGLVTRPGPA